MRKDDDASHENVARTRMGDGEGSDEQSDAFRSQAPKGAGDETGAAWRSETALITVFGKHCDCNAQKCTHLKRLAPLASHLLLLSHCVLTQHEGQRKKSNYNDKLRELNRRHMEFQNMRLSTMLLMHSNPMGRAFH